MDSNAQGGTEVSRPLQFRFVLGEWFEAQDQIHRAFGSRCGLFSLAMAGGQWTSLSPWQRMRKLAAPTALAVATALSILSPQSADAREQQSVADKARAESVTGADPPLDPHLELARFLDLQNPLAERAEEYSLGRALRYGAESGNGIFKNPFSPGQLLTIYNGRGDFPAFPLVGEERGLSERLRDEVLEWFLDDRMTAEQLLAENPGTAGVMLDKPVSRFSVDTGVRVQSGLVVVDGVASEGRRLTSLNDPLEKAYVAYHEAAHASIMQEAIGTGISSSLLQAGPASEGTESLSNQRIGYAKELASDIAATLALISDYGMWVDQSERLVDAIAEFRRSHVPEDTHNVRSAYRAVMEGVLARGEEQLGRIHQLTKPQIGLLSTKVAIALAQVEVAGVQDAIVSLDIPVGAELLGAELALSSAGRAPTEGLYRAVMMITDAEKKESMRQWLASTFAAGDWDGPRITSAVDKIGGKQQRLITQAGTNPAVLDYLVQGLPALESSLGLKARLQQEVDEVVQLHLDSFAPAQNLPGPIL